MGYRIGIDVGGTFTDFISIDSGGGFYMTKTPSTPRDQTIGVMEGLKKIALKENIELRDLLYRTDIIVHGSTIGTNTMLEYKGAVTGLITTKGFRDDLELRRGYKESIFNLRYPPPHPIVPRRRRLGVSERLDHHGEVVIPLDEGEAIEAIRNLKRMGVEAIAVCLLYSFLNPGHEKRIAELIQEEFPGVFLSLSHEVLPQLREFERVSTTVINSYTGPKVIQYLERLDNTLKSQGYRHDLLIMLSSGGIMGKEYVGKNSVYTLLSGPAGGAMGGTYMGGLLDKKNLITIDMGGTSYDICLIKNCQPSITTSAWFSRYRIAVPMIDIHTIGAGGGSIAWVDSGGALHVGPQSAGADPGPICYGKGGWEPTVTDANMVLGYINPRYFLGGEMEIVTEGIREAITQKIGDPLNLDVVEAAHGIFRIVNNNMANGIRVVSVQKGYDPRDFTLMAFGGNGPVHAGRQARDLGIKSILVPKTATAFSALGLLASDFKVTRMGTYMSLADEIDLEKVNKLFESMSNEGREELSRVGFTPSSILLQHYADFHYEGQSHEITVPLSCQGERITSEEWSAGVRGFHKVHEQLHTFSNPDQPVYVINLRLELIGPNPRPRIPELEVGEGNSLLAFKEKRPVYFEEYHGFKEINIYDGNRLKAEDIMEGPCIIEEPGTTIVVYPGQVARLSRSANYLIQCDMEEKE